MVRSLASLLLALALAFAAVRFGPSACSGPAYDTMDLPFDRATWLAHADENEHANPRRAMLRDLARRLAAPGTRREDVERLLGPPNSIRGGNLVYVCGWDGAFQMDAWHFTVTIDAQGLVTGTRQSQG